MGGGDQSARDLARRLEEALGRFGVAGSVAVTSDVATLHGNGPTVSAELGALIAEWEGLPEDTRARRVSEIARRLSSQRRAVSLMATAPARKAPIWLRPAALTAALALGALALGRAVQLLSVPAPAPRPSRSPVAKEFEREGAERAARAARVCEGTRSRVMRGAVVGPTDAEGWVVELWLLRDPERPEPSTDPALAEFVARESTGAKGRVVWTNAPSLAGVQGAGTRLTVAEADVPATGTPVLRGARISFTGRYVPLYFDEVPRRDYLRLARALTDALGTEYAALYARCAGDEAHEIGSWFRGPTPGGAVVSLLFFMGAFGERPALRAALLAPPGANGADLGYAFQSVSNAAATLKKARVMTMLGPELGMIAGLDGHVSTISFPFRDANRAARASYAVARELGIEQVR